MDYPMHRLYFEHWQITFVVIIILSPALNEMNG